MTHEYLSIDAQSKIHVEKFHFDKTRISECLQYVTNKLQSFVVSVPNVGRAVKICNERIDSSKVELVR